MAFFRLPGTDSKSLRSNVDHVTTQQSGIYDKGNPHGYDGSQKQEHVDMLGVFIIACVVSKWSECWPHMGIHSVLGDMYEAQRARRRLD